MQQYLKWILFTFMCFSVVACSSPNSPKGVAKSFWDAVLAQDEAKTRQYSSADTQMAVNFSGNTIDWSKMKVRLGATDMVGNDAVVHTVVTDETSGAKYTFNTYLVQENNVWRVDYTRTRKASMTSEIFAQIVKTLHEFNTRLNEDFEDTVAGFREAAPDIKKELDALTDTLASHVNTVAHADHEMHKKVTDFKAAVLGIFAHHPEKVAPTVPTRKITEPTAPAAHSTTTQ